MRTAPASADKAFAARELAKFQAASGRWVEALDYVDFGRRSDNESLRDEATSLIYIEALIACRRLEAAEAYARSLADARPARTDYCCALSNVIAARTNGRDAHTGTSRLALLNRCYARQKLAEVGLSETSRGFVFGNLAAPERRSSSSRQPEKVSVLLSVRNAGHTLSIAVASILGQTWRNLELVVVDDGSTDSSWEILGRLAARDSRIAATRNPTSVGLQQSRNQALSLATGEFIATHCSDDWLHPELLEASMEAMHRDRDARLMRPRGVRVSSAMDYKLQVDEGGAEYLRPSAQSLIIRKHDLQSLGKWDGVAGADEELVQSAVATWGGRAVGEVLPGTPMFLHLEAPAMTQPSDLGGRARELEARREYSRQAEYWRRKVLLPARQAGQAVPVERVSTKRPFPIPGSLAPATWRTQHYPLVIVSDLSLLGGTRRCNEGYLAAAERLGIRAGLFHWPRYDLALAKDIAPGYRALSYGENVDILTADDRVSADLVIIHHPPIMKYLPDAVPRVAARRLAILVNQLPHRFLEEDNPYYERRDVEKTCATLFDMSPAWIPISPLVRRMLSQAGFSPLAERDWIPPLGRLVTQSVTLRSDGDQRHRVPVVGRHSRDHRTKWPETQRDLRAAFCADAVNPVRFLGGANVARQVVGRWPKNWQELPFDSIGVGDFLQTLDFFVHYTHSGYIEEFGRNVMEAMAAGVPAIVPARFREVFGEAACYAEPADVEALIRALWDSRLAYSEQVERGFRFVAEYASDAPVAQRLGEAIDGVF